MFKGVLSLLVCLALPAQAAAPEGMAEIAGNYYGQAFNGNDLDPVITVLAFDQQGRFTGNYSIEDETGIFEGNLSSLVSEGERYFSMEWTDQDGEGFLYMQFSPDYSSFDGYWTNTDGENQLPWSGRRQ